MVGDALAQDVPDLSIIDRRVQEGDPAPKRPDSRPVPTLEEAAPGTAAVDPFTLSGVVIEGATAFAPSDFTDAYEKYLLTRVSDREVDAILNAITQRYHEAGYFLSRAIVPAQDIANGILRIRVIEGYISSFSTEGTYPDTALLDAYARPILAERPATLATVERALLLMSDLPGLTLQPKLDLVNQESGEYSLVAELSYQTVSAFGRLDNRGTPDVGRLQGWLGGSLNGVLGFGETITATFITVPNEPKELLFGSLNGTVPINRQGTYVSAYGAYSAIDAGGRSAQFDSDSWSKQGILTIGHPIVRSRAQNLWINGSFDYRNFEQEELGQTITDDRLRVLRADLSYQLQDKWDGLNAFGVGISQGLGILGATDDDSQTKSRSDGKSTFTKLTANATRVQMLPAAFSVRVSIAGQWSSEPLLSYEEFNLGGEAFGRAYDYGELTGEHGAAGSAEVRYGRDLNWRWLSEYQFYGFYDIGGVWNERSGDGLDFDHLSSAGLGFRLRLEDTLRTGFEAAKPLDRDVSSTSDNDWRFFFSAIATY